METFFEYKNSFLTMIKKCAAYEQEYVEKILFRI